MAHRTWSARYHAKIGKTKTQLIREGIQQLQKRKREQEELAAYMSDAGWREGEPNTFLLYQNDRLKAEVFKIPDRFSFKAVIWHDGDYAQHDTRVFAIEAMRWCVERLEHAAALSAHAAELERTGAEDASEGSA